MNYNIVPDASNIARLKAMRGNNELNLMKETGKSLGGAFNSYQQGQARKQGKRDLNELLSIIYPNRPNVAGGFNQRQQQAQELLGSEAVDNYQNVEGPITPSDNDILNAGGLDSDLKRQEFLETMPQVIGKTPEEAAEIFAERIIKLKSEGRDPRDTMAIAQNYLADPEMGAQQITTIAELMENERARQLVANNPGSLKLLESLGIGGKKEMSELDKIETEQQYKRLGEKRDQINAIYKTVDDDIKGIASSYNVIKELSKEVLKGNRTAVAQQLISLVKLGDPNSAVLAGEMAAALNIKGLEQAVLDADFKSIGALLDTLNPANVDIADLMNVAAGVKKARGAEIVKQYNYALEQRGLLPEKGQNLTFSKIRDDDIKDFESGLNSDVPAWFEIVGLTEDKIKDYMDATGVKRAEAIEDLAETARETGATRYQKAGN